MRISLTSEQVRWLRDRVSTDAALEAAALLLIDERIAELSLEQGDLSWARPMVDDGVAALDRGEAISVEEHKARNARRLAALDR